ncbi:TonB-dependent receptor [Novosphingobium resinovorum]
MRKTSLIIAGLMASASPVLAEEAPIVVTAPGGAIDLDEAREIDPQALDIAGKRDLGRALERTVPGLTLAESTGNPWQAAITWRGFSASALQGAEQGMAVYLDGVRFNQPFGDVVLLDVVPEMALANAQLNDANPVLGRNALAGSLLLTTHDGLSLSGLRLQADVDTVGSVGGSASLGLGDKADNLLIVAEARHDDGWRVASPSTLRRVFAKGVHDAGTWGIEVQGLAADTDLTGNGVAPVELLDAKWNAVFTTPDVTHTRFARLVAAPWIAAGETGRIELRAHWQTLNRKSANGDLADFGPCEDDAGYLCLGDDDEFEEPLLANGARVVNDPAVDDYAVFNRGRERTRSGGAMLQWLDERETGNGTRRFAVGASWERAHPLHRHHRTGRTGGGPLGRGPRPAADLGRGRHHPGRRRHPHERPGAFRQRRSSADPALTVEAGARWSRNTVRLDDRLGDALDGSHRFSRLNPSIEFDYALGADVHATAGFALTSRNPTPAELSCADPESPCTLANFFIADPPLKAMTARNWHAGLSGGRGALSWRVNGWRSDTKNDIRMIASEVRGRAYFANLGESRRQGIEASADWRQGGWRLSGSYAFTDAKFRQDFAASSPPTPRRTRTVWSKSSAAIACRACRAIW